MAIHDMASIHRQSLREESERIKAEFSKLISENKVTSEMAVLFQSLLMLVNLLMAIFLEKDTKKNQQELQQAILANRKG
jgi:transposase